MSLQEDAILEVMRALCSVLEKKIKPAICNSVASNVGGDAKMVATVLFMKREQLEWK